MGAKAVLRAQTLCAQRLWLSVVVRSIVERSYGGRPARDSTQRGGVLRCAVSGELRSRFGQVDSVPVSGAQSKLVILAEQSFVYLAATLDCVVAELRSHAESALYDLGVSACKTEAPQCRARGGRTSKLVRAVGRRRRTGW